jgi:hypothetical protein
MLNIFFYMPMARGSHSELFLQTNQDVEVHRIYLHSFLFFTFDEKVTNLILLHNFLYVL